MPPVTSEYIKHQFDDIVKDTKILCELEPFVKKWSIEETFPKENQNLAKKSVSASVFPDLETLETYPEEKRNEMVLRRMKEIMTGCPQSVAGATNGDDEGCAIASHHQFYDSENAVHPSEVKEDQYDLELLKTLKAIEEIEDVDVVTQPDLEDYVRGLGGKPDGPDLGSTTIREWKHIFIEHWLYLNQKIGDKTKVMREKMEMRKETKAKAFHHQEGPKNDHINFRENADSATFRLPKVNLENHFTTRNRRPLPTAPRNMFTLRPENALRVPPRPCPEKAIGLQSRSLAISTLPSKKIDLCNTNGTRKLVRPATQGTTPNKSLLTRQQNEYCKTVEEPLKNRKVTSITSHPAIKSKETVVPQVSWNKKSSNSKFSINGHNNIEKQKKLVNKSIQSHNNGNSPSIKRNIPSATTSINRSTVKLLQPSVRPSSAVPFPIKPGAIIRRMR